jgi:hypothetical protein
MIWVDPILLMIQALFSEGIKMVNKCYTHRAAVESRSQLWRDKSLACSMPRFREGSGPDIVGGLLVSSREPISSFKSLFSCSELPFLMNYDRLHFLVLV